MRTDIPLERKVKILLMVIFLAGAGFLLVSAGLIVSGILGAGPVQIPEVQMQPSVPYLSGPVQEANSGLVISVLDTQTGQPVGDSTVFINGREAGSTDGKTGTLEYVPETGGDGRISVRIVKDGYQDTTVFATPSSDSRVSVSLKKSVITPVQVSGDTKDHIDVVFLPSNTTYDCSAASKVVYHDYPGGREVFAEDVRKVINATFLKLGSYTSSSYPLQSDYQDKFNFYYYWDNETFGDAFSGCAGTIPSSYWSHVSFSDVTVILYPDYIGTYTGSPCQPRGCTNPNGVGRVYLKIAANDRYLMLHEMGHALFGLMDTYCGDTYYIENRPNPNIWSSLGSCTATADSNSWNSGDCTRIARTKPTLCSKDFWRYDPSPDIMKEGYSGKFGNASTKRIINILGGI